MIFSFFNKKISIDNCLWISFILWLIIDSITGYFLNNGINIALSQLFKLFVLILIIIKLFKKYYKLFLCVFIYIIIYSLSLILQSEDLIVSLLHLSKPLTTFMLYLYFDNYSKSDPNFIKKSMTIFWAALIVLITNVCIGLLGFGFSTYELQDVGYKGFFYAGNELGGIALVIFPLFMLKAYKKNKTLFWGIGLLFLIIGGLIATKSCIIIPILSLLCIPIIYSPPKKRIRILISFSIIFFIIGPFLLSWFGNSEIDAIIKIINTYNEKGIETTITGGRDAFWSTSKDEFYNSNIGVQILGLGGNRTVEMDPMDILLNYGYLGFIIIYSFLIRLLIRAYKMKSINEYNKLIIFIDIMLIGLSSMAGHIIFSTMSGLYIALINSFIKLRKNTNLI